MRRQMLRPLPVLLSALVLISLLVMPASAATRPAGGLAGQRVCLDPGHGGSDPGAVNQAFDLQEKDINLDVSIRLKSLLAAGGAAVVMTRSDDTYQTNNDRYTFCNAEKATLLVSVHTNSSTNAAADGAMALYMKRADQPLAQALYGTLYPALQSTAPDPANFTNYGLSKYASGVLLKSKMPAVMMEPVLMSNAGEAALLVQPIYDETGAVATGCSDFSCRRAQIAQALYDGILAYLASR